MPSTNLYRKRKLSLKNYTAAFFSLQNKCHEPRGISFLQGGKREFSPVHLFAAHSFCQTCTRYKARHTRTHTYTHALHTISNDEETKKKKKKKQDDVACCTRKKN